MSKLLKRVLSSLCSLVSVGMLSSAKRVKLQNGEAKIKGLNQGGVKVDEKRDKVKFNGKWYSAVKVGVFFIIPALGIAIPYSSKSDKKEQSDDNNEQNVEEQGEKNEKREDLKKLAEDHRLDAISSLMERMAIRVKFMYNMKLKKFSAIVYKNDGGSKSKLCQWDLNYAKDVGDGEESLFAGKFHQRDAFSMDWLSEETLVKHSGLVKDGRSVLYDLFDKEKGEDSRRFKLALLGFAARHIACALQSGNMDNLEKFPFDSYGGLGFRNFVKFVGLVGSKCVSEWKDMEPKKSNKDMKPTKSNEVESKNLDKPRCV